MWDYDAHHYVHNKPMLIDHPDGYGGTRRLVSTGSDNWGMRSLHNDDLVLMIDADDRPRLYQRYVDYFEEVRRRGASA